jgi:hypothetical protein
MALDFFQILISCVLNRGLGRLIVVREDCYCLSVSETALFLLHVFLAAVHIYCCGLGRLLRQWHFDTYVESSRKPQVLH